PLLWKRPVGTLEGPQSRSLPWRPLRQRKYLLLLNKLLRKKLPLRKMLLLRKKLVLNQTMPARIRMTPVTDRRKTRKTSLNTRIVARPIQAGFFFLVRPAGCRLLEVQVLYRPGKGNC